jgi:hypothetical protein
VLQHGRLWLWCRTVCCAATPLGSVVTVAHEMRLKLIGSPRNSASLAEGSERFKDTLNRAMIDHLHLEPQASNVVDTITEFDERNHEARS